MNKATPRYFSLFNIQIDNLSMREAVEKVVFYRRQQYPQTICFVNVNTLNLAKHTNDLTDAVNDANWVFPDGSGIRIAANCLNLQVRENVNGTDMLPKLCERAVAAGKRIFLLGSKPGIAESAADQLKQTHPGLEIAGTHHGYFNVNESSDVIEQINAAKTDILLIGFGSPIQEHWMQQNKVKLKVNSVLAVGGLFDFYSGQIPRAPLWLRRKGMEWIWRLLQEPRTKFHRYVIGNPIFLWRCFWHLRKASA